MNYDIIVIGSGPGGYVAAIRAAQLGFKTGVVERAELGGICLNWGCIPTKALLKSASVFEYIRHASEYGIVAGEAKPDFEAIIKRSRDVADSMSKGIQFLFKKTRLTTSRVLGKLNPARWSKSPMKTEQLPLLRQTISSLPPAAGRASFPASNRTGKRSSDTVKR